MREKNHFIVSILFILLCLLLGSAFFWYIYQNNRAAESILKYENAFDSTQLGAADELSVDNNVVNVDVPPILFKPHSMSPTITVEKLFQLLENQEYEEASQFIVLSDEDKNMLISWNEDISSPTIPLLLKRYCEQNGGICLSVNIVSSTTSTSTAEVVIQFIQQDGTVFVFESCCGADEKDTLTIDTFTYQLQYIQDGWRVTSLPPYRP
jgi:hypothetical protein